MSAQDEAGPGAATEPDEADAAVDAGTQRAIDRLIALGLVERHIDAGGEESIRLTEAGEQARAEVDQAQPEGPWPGSD